MRKKLFVNDNTLEELKKQANEGLSFTAACRALRRNPWHVREKAEDLGLFDELQAAFPRLNKNPKPKPKKEPDNIGIRHLKLHNMKAPVPIPQDRTVGWLMKSWRVS